MKFLRLKKYSKIITQPLTVFLLLAHLAKSSLQVKHCSVYSTSAPEKVTAKKEFFFFFSSNGLGVLFVFFICFTNQHTHCDKSLGVSRGTRAIARKFPCYRC